MSDTNERSVASAGSVAGGVVQQLRDSFAAAALTGLLSSLPNGDQYHSFAVEKAWSLADAMIRGRGKNNTPNDAVPAADGGGSLHQEGSRVRASATPTGNTHEPAAWGVVDDLGLQLAIHPTPGHASHMARNFGRGIAVVVPLYRHRQPALTDAEREAVIHAMAALDHVGTEWTLQCAATLRGLLERLK